MSRKVFFVLIAIIVFTTCKKEDASYALQGFIFDSRDSHALGDVQVTIKKQIVQGGVFNNNFNTAASTTTPSNGSYYLNWPRENFSALKLVCEKDQYVTSNKTLDVQSFSVDKLQTISVHMHPEAFINVHVHNVNTASALDQFSFTFTNANFDCACCSNGWQTFSGASVDTTFECKLYGDSWLKYQKQIATAEADTVLNDSIFCPAFQTTNLDIQY